VIDTHRKEVIEIQLFEPRLYLRQQINISVPEMRNATVRDTVSTHSRNMDRHRSYLHHNVHTPGCPRTGRMAEGQAVHGAEGIDTQ
jgi:hypothetical protein